MFYPLRISSLEQGPTKVDLLVFSSVWAGKFLGLRPDRIQRAASVEITPQEIQGLDPAWKDFFGVSGKMKMDRWKIEGKSTELTSDIKVQ